MTVWSDTCTRWRSFCRALAVLLLFPLTQAQEAEIGPADGLIQKASSPHVIHVMATLRDLLYTHATVLGDTGNLYVTAAIRTLVKSKSRDKSVRSHEERATDTGRRLQKTFFLWGDYHCSATVIAFICIKGIEMGSQWFKFPMIKCSLHCFDQCSLFKGLLGVERQGWRPEYGLFLYYFLCIFWASINKNCP